MKVNVIHIAKAIRYETVIRQVYARMFSGVMPFYIVNEFPRSGGSWISSMLGEALNVPFPRKRPPGFEPSILQAHHINPLGLRNVVSVFRDGRDVMVSWYYHCLFESEFEKDLLVKSVAKEISFKDRDDIVNNLPQFIEWAFENSRHPGFSWAEYVDVWYGHPNATPVKYEDFVNDGVATLIDTVKRLAQVELDPLRAKKIIDKHSFDNLSGRRAGDEVKTSIMRKGIVGDWQNAFNQTSREVFAHYAGDQLIKLGYEPDRKWIAG